MNRKPDTYFIASLLTRDAFMSSAYTIYLGGVNARNGLRRVSGIVSSLARCGRIHVGRGVARLFPASPFLYFPFDLPSFSRPRIFYSPARLKQLPLVVLIIPV